MLKVGRKIPIFVVSVALVFSGFVALAQPATASHPSGETFEVGDIFVSTESSEVWWYRISGTSATLLHKLDTSDGTGQSTGSTISPDGQLYATQFEQNKIDRWDADGAPLGTFGSGFGDDAPESIVFDRANGEAYVGSIEEDTISQSEGRVYHFAPDGSTLNVFNVDVERRGADWIDLADDRCTLLYTSEGREVKRYDVCNDLQLTDFTDVSALGETDGELFAIRQLPDGQILAADEDNILRIAADGSSIVQTYDAPNMNRWFSLTLDPNDPSAFWAADQMALNVFRFDIDTGDRDLVINIAESDFPSSSDDDTNEERLSGISIAGEPGRADPCREDIAFDGYYLTDQSPASGSGGDLQMNQRSLGEPPSFNGASDLTLSDSASLIYLANVNASADSEHNDEDWTLHATTKATGPDGYTAEMGIWDPDTSSFTAASSAATIDQTGFVSTTLPVSSPVTFPEGDYLALRLTDVSDGDDTTLDLVGPDVSPTCLEEPTQEGDHYPTPEVGTLFLSTAGLVAVGMVGMRRRTPP